ncbi:hypothetical protein CSW23_03830 [Thermus scotoductus]|uniref:Uncharacterized protein n=1 Tax=Thermus scotoductus TaxID=37636 RepID=A0A430V5N3_THESC|nr:hypothetical protein CSW47_02780 [Thermus scotoductus]RTI01159.1 hypothetical protein CSW31_04225 [Thermus scotoductus]RTI19052.1 hypothetical protein CSW23_03830 [Thermus scotoductus]RTI61599.1 hypothetical protein CSW14_00170 [Thermus scotoductus]
MHGGIPLLKLLAVPLSPPENPLVYVDEGLHRRLKAVASLPGRSPSESMLEAALRLLEAPDRRRAAARMDRLRSRMQTRFTPEELRGMRDEGRP